MWRGYCGCGLWVRRGARTMCSSRSTILAGSGRSRKARVCVGSGQGAECKCACSRFPTHPYSVRVHAPLPPLWKCERSRGGCFFSISRAHAHAHADVDRGARAWAVWIRGVECVHTETQFSKGVGVLLRRLCRDARWV
eukprot:365283-Chlamydomonas_euryale.AAC.8